LKALSSMGEPRDHIIFGVPSSRGVQKTAGPKEGHLINPHGRLRTRQKVKKTVPLHIVQSHIVSHQTLSHLTVLEVPPRSKLDSVQGVRNSSVASKVRTSTIGNTSRNCRTQVKQRKEQTTPRGRPSRTVQPPGTHNSRERSESHKNSPAKNQRICLHLRNKRRAENLHLPQRE